MYTVMLQLPDTFDRLLQDHLVDLAIDTDSTVIWDLSSVITAELRRVYIATLLGAIAMNLGRADVANEITRLNRPMTH